MKQIATLVLIALVIAFGVYAFRAAHGAMKTDTRLSEVVEASS